MKSILISIKPKWCAKIMNREKTVEVRKGTALYKAIQKLIDENGYADIYGYCTKGKPYLGKKEIGRNFYNEPIYTYDLDNGETFKGKGNKKFYGSVGVYSINGKVIFKFRCYNVEEFTLKMMFGGLYFSKNGSIDFPNEDAQLDNFELLDYAGDKHKLYAIHISDLEIFDKPKELSEFYRVGVKEEYEHIMSIDERQAKPYIDEFYRLTKAPQSWQFVESEQ